MSDTTENIIGIAKMAANMLVLQNDIEGARKSARSASAEGAAPVHIFKIDHSRLKADPGHLVYVGRFFTRTVAPNLYLMPSTFAHMSYHLVEIVMASPRAIAVRKEKMGGMPPAARATRVRALVEELDPTGVRRHDEKKLAKLIKDIDARINKNVVPLKRR